MSRGPVSFSAAVGAFVEAWAELRVNRVRLFLSLLGVTMAVAALTGVTGLGAIAEQAARESAESGGGRPATCALSVEPKGSETLDVRRSDRVFAATAARFGIDYASSATTTERNVQMPEGVQRITSTIVDPPYGEMHRIRMLHGDWLAETDAARLAPAIVVNEAFWNALGAPDLATHPVVSIDGPDAVTAVVTGVTASSSFDVDPRLYQLPSDRDLSAAPLGDEPEPYLSVSYEIWIPEKHSAELGHSVEAALRGELGASAAVTAERFDYQARGGDDGLGPVRAVITGVGGLILFLGGLGLVNITLVTVRQRIREIGVRRSFGATAPRVFFSVMLESVAGTAVAGAVGVMVAAFVVGSPAVQGAVSGITVSDVPPFPVSAALLGMAAALAVGTLAGLLPAIVAVRVKVIDAIRY